MENSNVLYAEVKGFKVLFNANKPPKLAKLAFTVGQVRIDFWQNQPKNLAIKMYKFQFQAFSQKLAIKPENYSKLLFRKMYFNIIVGSIS